MFGLPPMTSVIVFGFPIFWIVYTLVFLWLSRHWDDEPDSAGRNAGGEQR